MAPTSSRIDSCKEARAQGPFWSSMIAFIFPPSFSKVCVQSCSAAKTCKHWKPKLRLGHKLGQPSLCTQSPVSTQRPGGRGGQLEQERVHFQLHAYTLRHDRFHFPSKLQQSLCAELLRSEDLQTLETKVKTGAQTWATKLVHPITSLDHSFRAVSSVERKKKKQP